jgi:preprotein translocase subunit SecG
MNPDNNPGSHVAFANPFELSRAESSDISQPSNTGAYALVDLREKFARIRGIYFFLFFIICILLAMISCLGVFHDHRKYGDQSQGSHRQK